MNAPTTTLPTWTDAHSPMRHATALTGGLIGTAVGVTAAILLAR